ncbi:uncharacterized protein LOC143877170 [Tasmannia lanceolata]|uniref:uncharacterized protein LOC143877170 n=1 Tax=Tasmannia lanceolata TaxID=3420 RepID=UPI004063C369
MGEMDSPRIPLNVESLNGGGFTGETSRKRSLENNGDASSDYPMKFKRRKVSAIRDFPAGCGRFTIEMGKKSCENAGSFDTAQSPTVEAERADSMDYELVKSSHQMELPELLKSSKPEMVEELRSLDPKESLELSTPLKDNATEFSKSLDQSELLNSSKTVKPLIVELPNSSDLMELDESLEALTPLDQPELPDVPKSSDQSKLVEMQSIVSPTESLNALVPVDKATEEPLPKKYPPLRRVSADRDFPPFCGRDAPLVTMEECLKAVPSSRKKSVDDVGGHKPSNGLPRTVKSENVKVNSMGNDMDQIGKKVQVRDPLVIKSKVTIDKEVGGIVKVKSASKSRMSENDTTEVRDTIQVRTASGSKLKGEDMNEFREKSQTRAAPDIKLSRPGTKSPYVTAKTDRENKSLAGKVGKESLANYKDKSPKGKSVRDSENQKIFKNQSQGEEPMDLESFGDRIVVQALMAAPNCPWRKGKRLSMSFSNSKRKGK